jgi:hypothetical protein
MKRQRVGTLQMPKQTFRTLTKNLLAAQFQKLAAVAQKRIPFMRRCAEGRRKELSAEAKLKADLSRASRATE